MAFNYSRLHTPTNAIKPPRVCILIILLGILRQNASSPPPHPTTLMLPSPWQPRVAALMSESPPRTLVQAPGQVMQAAAGHVLTPRHKMAAHFAPQAYGRICSLRLLFLLLPLFESKDEEEAASSWSCQPSLPHTRPVGRPSFPQLASSSRAVFPF